MIKWVTAILGYTYFRFGGAILGYFIGSVLEQLFRQDRRNPFASVQSQRMQTNQVQLNLLSLAAIVIKADGKVDERELRFVRNYFITNYGEAYASSIFAKFNTEVKKEQQNLNEITRLFVQRAPYETRLQILHFLFAIANADGHVAEVEVQKILQIANALQLRSMDFESIKAMFVKSADNAYKILEISPSATDAEVKKAYRTMAKKYHPDKLQTDDVALKKGAQEKFQQVQAAYETIQKERGL
ncbi:MAG: TerB family tellurite resistance protein [Flavobacteriaceae bacterium]|nr:TerB family tellurite resistance protein [Flavobacteriaceae bacterium]